MSRTTLLTLLGLAAPGLVHAQETVIEGAVTDTTDLVLPGVTVEARSTEAGGPTETAVTDGVGAFAITGLPPGLYDVTFTLPGFQEDVRSGVVVDAGVTVTVDIVLSLRLLIGVQRVVLASVQRLGPGPAAASERVSVGR